MIYLNLQKKDSIRTSEVISLSTILAKDAINYAYYYSNSSVACLHPLETGKG